MAANLPSPDPGESLQARPGDTLSEKIAAFTARHILGRRNDSTTGESTAAPPAAEAESRGFADVTEVYGNTIGHSGIEFRESQRSLGRISHLTAHDIRELLNGNNPERWDVVRMEKRGEPDIVNIRDRWGSYVEYAYCPPITSPPRQKITLSPGYATDFRREYQGSPRYYEQLAALENNSAIRQQDDRLSRSLAEFHSRQEETEIRQRLSGNDMTYATTMAAFAAGVSPQLQHSVATRVAAVQQVSNNTGLSPDSILHAVAALQSRVDRMNGSMASTTVQFQALGDAFNDLEPLSLTPDEEAQLLDDDDDKPVVDNSVVVTRSGKTRQRRDISL